MKKIIPILFFFQSIFAFSDKDCLEKLDFVKNQESFSYFKMGPVYLGYEAGVGYRYKPRPYAGYGCVFNTSYHMFAAPFFSGRLELLSYPATWNDKYLGFMIGGGVGKINHITYFSKKWELFPVFEVVYGKEFIVEDKKRFWQITYAFPFIFSFNYGWGF